MGGIFWLFLRVLVTPEVQKTTPGGPGAALDHPPLAGLSWVICKLVCHRGCEPCAHAVIHLRVCSKVTYFQWFCQVLEQKQIVIVTFLDLLNPSDHSALV